MLNNLAKLRSHHIEREWERAVVGRQPNRALAAEMKNNDPHKMGRMFRLMIIPVTNVRCTATAAAPVQSSTPLTLALDDMSIVFGTGTSSASTLFLKMPRDS